MLFKGTTAAEETQEQGFCFQMIRLLITINDHNLQLAQRSSLFLPKKM